MTSWSSSVTVQLEKMAKQSVDWIGSLRLTSDLRVMAKQSVDWIGSLRLTSDRHEIATASDDLTGHYTKIVYSKSKQFVAQ